MATAKKSFSQPLGVIALLGSMASLSIGTSFAKHLFLDLGAQGVTAYRLGFSALILWLVWRPWRFKFSRQLIYPILLYGLSLGFMNFLFYMSLRTIPLGIALSIEFMGPLILALLTSRRLLDLIWIVLASAGLYLLLIYNSAGTTELDPEGVMFAASAGLFWALYIIFGQKTHHIHPGQATTFGITIAAVFVFPFAVTHTGIDLFIHPNLIFYGFIVALLSSAIPYSLEMISLQSLSSKNFSILLSLEPAMGSLAALFVLGENLVISQYLAIALVVIASIGATISKSKK